MVDKIRKMDTINFSILWENAQSLMGQVSVCVEVGKIILIISVSKNTSTVRFCQCVLLSCHPQIYAALVVVRCLCYTSRKHKQLSHSKQSYFALVSFPQFHSFQPLHRLEVLLLQYLEARGSPLWLSAILHGPREYAVLIRLLHLNLEIKVRDGQTSYPLTVMNPRLHDDSLTANELYKWQIQASGKGLRRLGLLFLRLEAPIFHLDHVSILPQIRIQFRGYQHPIFCLLHALNLHLAALL